MRLNPFPCGSFLRPHHPHHLRPVPWTPGNDRLTNRELVLFSRTYVGPISAGPSITPVYCERCVEVWREYGLVREG